MASATFDTSHAAKALTAAGFAAPQAEAITDTIREAFTESVATKADLDEVKAELEADIAEVKTALVKAKTELKTDTALVKTDLAEVRGELKVGMASMEARLAKRFGALYKQLWLVTVVLGFVAAVVVVVESLIGK